VAANQKVGSDKIEKAGFAFKYTDVTDALRNLLA
jgi:NAD dependent epimerase/dehydratase family enzyme